MDADGDFVVAWTSDGQDGDGYGAYAKLYNAAGTPQTGDIQLNGVTAGQQGLPAVAMDASGNFVAAWSSVGQDGSGYGVYAQRYSAAGAAIGSEFQVNTYTSGNQSGDEVGPTVAMDADGDFVVAWHSYDQDFSEWGVYGQRYDAAGVAQGGEFPINLYTFNSQRDPAVAMDSDGDFVVAWHSHLQDGSGDGVYARYFETAAPTVAAVYTQSGASIPPGGTVPEAITSLVIPFSKEMSTLGGGSGPTSVTNPANYELLQGITDISGSISGITYAYNPATEYFEASLALDAALLPGSYQLTASDAISTVYGTQLDGDDDTVAGGDFVLAFGIDPATVTGRQIFYNNSAWDGSSPGIADPGDSSAIATNKSAYLPGDGTITSASMSSYSRGLNGIFVDLTGAHGTLTPADFEFAISDQGSGAVNTNTPSTWTSAPAPTAFTVLPDTPVAGTDRVEFIWADNAIENRYLEVAVLGNDAAGGFNTNTGLASTDIFYFGNIIGDTFNDAAPTVWLTTSADETAIQASPIVSVATIESPYDIDRNVVHLASDRILARSNTIFALNKLDVSDPPAAPAPPAGPTAQPRAESAIATAVAIPSPIQSPAARPAETIAPAPSEPLPDPVDHFFAQLGHASSPELEPLFTTAGDVADDLELANDLLESLLPSARRR